jgi:hypothetical protein
MSDVSIERQDLLDRIPGVSWDDVVNALGAMVGAVETFIGGPLYPIAFYAAAVDERLIRGAWPDPRHLATLRACGVDCCLNLCAEREQDEDVIANGMITEQVPVTDNTVPTEAQVARVMEIIDAHPRTFMHCEAGKGRTGYLVARYLMRKGWEPWAALEEAERFGSLMPCQRDSILQWVRESAETAPPVYGRDPPEQA